MKDIAKYCGVSEGTVDRALNDRFGIKDETKQRVLTAAKELRYTPNHIAKSLATGSTKTIGVVCFDLTNYFFASLIDIIEAEAKERGYFINLILTHGQAEQERKGIRYLAERKVDGIILFPVGKGTQYTAMLKSLATPIVTVYNRLPPFPYVGVDGAQSMKESVCFLKKKGYETILFLTAQITKKKQQRDNVYLLEERQRGYVTGLQENGFHAPVVLEGRDEAAFLEQIALHAGSKTAVLCVADSLALWALEICHKNSISVPGQLGIMGYDNADVLQYVTPRLSSVSYDVHRLGKDLLSVLFAGMTEGETPKETLLGYSFFEGETL